MVRCLKEILRELEKVFFETKVLVQQGVVRPSTSSVHECSLIEIREFSGVLPLFDADE